MNKKKNIKLLRNRIKDFIELNKKTKNFIEDKYIIEDDTVYIPVKVDDINDFLIVNLLKVLRYYLKILLIM